MKKVLLIANDTTYVYNLRRELISALIGAGYEVSAACSVLLHAEELEALGCRLIPVSVARQGKNPFKDLTLYREYKKILKRERPDVALTYNIKPNVWGGMACKRYGIRYVPNITGLGTAVEYPGIMQKITTRLYRMGLKKADAVMFQNSENLAFFEKRKLLSKNTATVLLPGSGVNLEEHGYADYPGEGAVHFLFVGRALKEKGTDLYLRLAKEIKAEYPDTVFHICGACDDPRYLSIYREAEEEGTIVYHGEQKQMTPHFVAAHCVVHPTYYPEGMSNVLLEAAATGRPIVTTNRSGCREIVDDGVNGYVVPTNDYDALLAATKRFLSLTPAERAEMGKRGREKVEREFDRKIVVDRYFEVIANE